MNKAGKQKSTKKLGRWLSIAVGLVVVGLFVAALMPKPLPADIISVDRGDLTVTVNEDGQTRIKDRYVIDTPLDGHVARIELDAGDPVEENTVVARIVPLNPPLLDTRRKAEAEARLAAAKAAKRQALASIARAEASMQLASLEAERQANLGPSGATSAQAVEQSVYDLRAKREGVNSARFAARVAEYEAQVAEAALGRLGAGGQAGAQGRAGEIGGPDPVKHQQRVVGIIDRRHQAVGAGNLELLRPVQDRRIRTEQVLEMAGEARGGIGMHGASPGRGTEAIIPVFAALHKPGLVADLRFGYRGSHEHEYQIREVTYRGRGYDAKPFRYCRLRR